MFAIKGVPAGSDPLGDVPRYSRVPLGCSRPGACFSNCSDGSSAPESRFVFAFKIKVSNINFENHIRLSVNEAKLTGF